MPDSPAPRPADDAATASTDDPTGADPTADDPTGADATDDDPTGADATDDETGAGDGGFQNRAARRAKGKGTQQQAHGQAKHFGGRGAVQNPRQYGTRRSG